MNIFLTLYLLLVTKVNLNSGLLILIVSDGFAGRYLTRYKYLNGFSRIIERGVWSDNLIPEFPSLSMPNLYSLVTGMHPFEHGIVSDFMIDKDTGMQFWAGRRDSDYNLSFWDNAEPIWVTAGNQLPGHYSVGMYAWPGCKQMQFYSKHPPRCSKNYMMESQKETLNHKNVNLWLSGVETYQLVIMYHNDIDTAGRVQGPNAILNTANDSIVQFGQVLDDVLDHVDIMNEQHKDKPVNLIVVSDHGMTQLPQDNVVYVAGEVLLWIEQTIQGGPFMMLRPKKGYGQKVYDYLNKSHPIPHATVYWTKMMGMNKDTIIPQRYQYFESSRVLPLILIADPGFAIFTEYHRHFPPQGEFHPDDYLGMSGYDNENADMAGIFLGYGPAFKPGYRLRSAKLIDVHPLMCKLLNLSCHQTSGRLNRIYHVTIAGASVFKELVYLVVILPLCILLHCS